MGRKSGLVDKILSVPDRFFDFVDSKEFHIKGYDPRKLEPNQIYVEGTDRFTYEGETFVFTLYNWLKFQLSDFRNCILSGSFSVKKRYLQRKGVEIKEVVNQIKDLENKIILAYSPVVDFVLNKKYPLERIETLRHAGYDLKDLKQEGRLAIFTSMMKFSFNESGRFITLACVSISNKLNKLYERINAKNRLNYNKRISTHLEDEGYESLIDLINLRRVSEKTHDYYEDEDYKRIDLNSILKDVDIKSKLLGLPMIHSLVIKKRFGLFNERVQTYEDIAKSLHIKPYKVKKIEKIALRRLEIEFNPIKVYKRDYEGLSGNKLRKKDIRLYETLVSKGLLSKIIIS